MSESSSDLDALQLIHVVSHELNTALTMVIGNAHLLRTHGDGLDVISRRAALVDLEENADRLGSAIQNLLLLARLESAMRPVLEPVVLPKLVAELVDQECPRQQGRIVVKDPQVSQPVAVDRNLFRVVLRNVLENACLYSPKGSQVTVEARGRGEKVEVEIADQGPGIPESEREAVFQPFFRSPQVIGVVPGLGLGLTVAQKLAQLHGGNLTIGQDMDRGSKFVLSLPVARPTLA